MDCDSINAESGAIVKPIEPDKKDLLDDQNSYLKHSASDCDVVHVLNSKLITQPNCLSYESSNGNVGNDLNVETEPEIKLSDTDTNDVDGDKTVLKTNVDIVTSSALPSNNLHILSREEKVDVINEHLKIDISLVSDSFIENDENKQKGGDYNKSSNRENRSGNTLSSSSDYLDTDITPLVVAVDTNITTDVIKSSFLNYSSEKGGSYLNIESDVRCDSVSLSVDKKDKENDNILVGNNIKSCFDKKQCTVEKNGLGKTALLKSFIKNTENNTINNSSTSEENSLQSNEILYENIEVEEDFSLNKKLLYDIKVQNSSLNENQSVNCPDDFHTNQFLSNSISSIFTGTNTTQVVRQHLMFPYNHESYFSTCPEASTSCHTSYYQNCPQSKILALNSTQYNYEAGNEVAQRLSSSESWSGCRSIYTQAASSSGEKVDFQTSLNIQVSCGSGSQFENYKSLLEDPLYSKLSASEYNSFKTNSNTLNYPCHKSLDMGSRNSVAGSTEETFLSEFPPDRSDGSDSGLGSEFIDERTTVRTDSLSSDELDGGVMTSKWSHNKGDLRAVPSTSKQPRVIKSNLKRSHADESTGVKVKKIKRSIEFENVSIFYFPRTQGFICVPSQGGSTLGMSWTHSHAQTFTLSEHAAEQRRLHRHLVAQLRSTTTSTTSSSSDSDTDEQPSESEPDSNYYFLQPVPTRQRRAMLRAAGVHKIDSLEKDECRDIRSSREFCGCSCKGYCDADTCACSLAGIKCQVDRMNFPCACSLNTCGNSSGRIEFNPMRVRRHFVHTLMRLDLEKKQAQDDEEAALRHQANHLPEPCAQQGNFVNFPYRENMYGYQSYDTTNPSNYGYGYNGYMPPTYEHTDVGEFVSPGLEFQTSSYQQFPSSLPYPQMESSHYANNETKLESFSELLQSRYQEPEVTTMSNSSGATIPPGTEPDKQPSATEEVPTENFGEIIKKTMVDSVTT